MSYRFLPRGIRYSIVVGVIALLWLAGHLWNRRDVIGTVFNANSKTPMASVYILARYADDDVVPFAGSSSSMRCRQLRGMFTGSDGRYRFAYQAGAAPQILIAAPGHERQMHGFWSNRRNFYLVPRTPGRVGGDSLGCRDIQSGSDREVAVTFLTIEDENERNYGTEQSRRNSNYALSDAKR